MQSKYIVIGALAGIFLGIIISFAYPTLLKFGFKFNLDSNRALGYQSNYFSKFDYKNNIYISIKR